MMKVQGANIVTLKLALASHFKGLQQSFSFDGQEAVLQAVMYTDWTFVISFKIISANALTYITQRLFE